MSDILQNIIKDYKNLKELEKRVDFNSPKEVWNNLTQKRAVMTNTLEKLALQHDYKKLRTSNIYPLCFHNAFYRKNTQNNHDLFILKERSTDITHIKDIPKRDIKKAATYRIMEEMGDYQSKLVDLGWTMMVLTPLYLVGMYMLTPNPVLGLGIMISTIPIARISMDREKLIRKEKATEFLEQYKDKGLLTTGQKALESMIGA